MFLSPHPFLRIAGVVKERIDYHPATGVETQRYPGVDIQFEPNAPTWAMEQAFANPTFIQAWNTLPEGAMKAAYVGCYDTDAREKAEDWGKCYVRKCGRDHTLKEHINDALLQGAGSLYVLAEQDKPAVPYPNYVKDTTVVGRRTIEHVLENVRKTVDLGIEPSLIRSFEQNTGRSESAQIIEFLATLDAGELVAA